MGRERGRQKVKGVTGIERRERFVRRLTAVQELYFL